MQVRYLERHGRCFLFVAELPRRIYGYTSFCRRQADVTAGGDAVVLFPTGASKPPCFQVPALFRDGVGIVVPPLTALMRNQVEALPQVGIRAAASSRGVPSIFLCHAGTDGHSKNLAAVQTLAGHTGTAMPMTSLCMEIHRLMVSAGFGPADNAALMKFYDGPKA